MNFYLDKLVGNVWSGWWRFRNRLFGGHFASGILRKRGYLALSAGYVASAIGGYRQSGTGRHRQMPPSATMACLEFIYQPAG